VGLAFEWDDDKYELNIRRHGVDFERAALIFTGAMVEELDDREDYGEDRMIALGLAQGIVYRVTYTMRGKSYRLISAQKANKRDQDRYYRETYDR
jgi:uncharacterized protein